MICRGLKCDRRKADFRIWEDILDTRRFSSSGLLNTLNTLWHHGRSMNWWIIVSNGRVSEEKYSITSSLVVIAVHVQQPPRSWTTIKIGCHYSPQSLSTISCHLSRGPPPLSDANTIQDPLLLSRSASTTQNPPWQDVDDTALTLFSPSLLCSLCRLWQTASQHLWYHR